MKKLLKNIILNIIDYYYYMTAFNHVPSPKIQAILSDSDNTVVRARVACDFDKTTPYNILEKLSLDNEALVRNQVRFNKKSSDELSYALTDLSFLLRVIYN
jgi:hypothetical protein